MNDSRKNIYPSMIVLMIGGFLIFLCWSAFQAAGLGSKVADADYYSKGLKYNTSQVEKRAAEILGWKLETRLSGRMLEIHITDREGAGVGRGVGTLYLAYPGRQRTSTFLSSRTRLEDTVSNLPTPSREPSRPVLN